MYIYYCKKIVEGVGAAGFRLATARLSALTQSVGAVLAAESVLVSPCAAIMVSSPPLSL